MPEGRLGHCKLCELADFADPELRELIRDVFAVGSRALRRGRLSGGARVPQVLGGRDDPPGVPLARRTARRRPGPRRRRGARGHDLLAHAPRRRGRRDRPLRDARMPGPRATRARTCSPTRAATGTGSGIRSGSPFATWTRSSSTSRTIPSTRSSPRARSSTSATSRTSAGASRRCSGCCVRAGSSPWRPSSGSRAIRSAIRDCCASTSRSSAPCCSTGSGGIPRRRWSFRSRTRRASPRSR